ncbi:MAG: hypothetical protein K5882_03650 [Bacteroidales bacterium]|nr:hypothetical protein [Bacteroidales bacterium]
MKNVPGHSRPLRTKHNSLSKIEGEFSRSGTAVPKMVIKAYGSPDISVLQH